MCLFPLKKKKKKTVLAILAGEKWYLIVVLIWASLMTHGVGHLYTECWS